MAVSGRSRPVGKWVLNGLFVLAVLAFGVWYAFRGQDARAVWTCVRAAIPGWCALAAALVVLFILSESVILHRLLRAVGERPRILHCFLYSFTGFFFSCITPSASGGQPMQVWMMRRDGLKAAAAVPVLIIVTILYKLVLVALGLAVLLGRPAAVMAALRPVEGWCWLGVALNVAAVAVMLLLVLAPDRMARAADALCRAGGRLLHWKRPQERRQRLAAWMARYRAAAVCFRHCPGALAQAAALTFVQRGLLFAVTWCCCRALGLCAGGGQAALTVVLQGMIAVAVDMLPLPGGSGISEALFVRLFTPLLGEAMVSPALVLSRGIGFYAQMGFGAAGTLTAFFVIGRRASSVPLGEGGET